jgi:hypothetical protein
MIRLYKTIKKDVKVWKRNAGKYVIRDITEYCKVDTFKNRFESVDLNGSGCLCEIKTATGKWLRQHFNNRDIVERVNEIPQGYYF